MVGRMDIMKKFLKYYTNPNESDMNYGLINKEYDDDIVEYFDEESELFDDAPTNGTGNGDKSNDHNG